MTVLPKANTNLHNRREENMNMSRAGPVTMNDFVGEDQQQYVRI
jgi:hypothetical protein